MLRHFPRRWKSRRTTWVCNDCEPLNQQITAGSRCWQRANSHPQLGTQACKAAYRNARASHARWLYSRVEKTDSQMIRVL